MNRLIDYFPNWTLKGVFTRLTDWTPWHSDATVNKRALDRQYFGNRSGWRYPSPFLMKILPAYHVIDDTQFEAIDEMLKVMFAEKWSRIYAAMNLSYTVGDNVNLTEHTLSDGTINLDNTDTGEAATNIDSDSTNQNFVVPFGAANNTYAETSKQVVDGNTQSSKLSNTTKKVLDSDQSHEDEITKTITGKSAGASYAAEVQRELELRRTTFFELVFDDLDEVLTSPYWV